MPARPCSLGQPFDRRSLGERKNVSEVAPIRGWPLIARLPGGEPPRSRKFSSVFRLNHGFSPGFPDSGVGRPPPALSPEFLPEILLQAPSNGLDVPDESAWTPGGGRDYNRRPDSACVRQGHPWNTKQSAGGGSQDMRTTIVCSLIAALLLSPGEAYAQRGGGGGGHSGSRGGGGGSRGGGGGYSGNRGGGAPGRSAGGMQGGGGPGAPVEWTRPGRCAGRTWRRKPWSRWRSVPFASEFRRTPYGE